MAWIESLISSAGSDGYKIQECKTSLYTVIVSSFTTNCIPDLSNDDSAIVDSDIEFIRMFIRKVAGTYCNKHR